MALRTRRFSRSGSEFLSLCIHGVLFQAFEGDATRYPNSSHYALITRMFQQYRDQHDQDVNHLPRTIESCVVSNHDKFSRTIARTSFRTSADSSALS